MKIPELILSLCDQI